MMHSPAKDHDASSKPASCLGCVQLPLPSDDHGSIVSLPKLRLALLHQVFEAYSHDGHMDVTRFCRFLCEVQCERDVREEHASAIMSMYCEIQPYHFTEQHFVSFLFDPVLNFAIHNHVHHDMSLPLSCYFIFTGHNSYLTGNQLIGTSSDKPIADSILKGVRVVELDLWPDGEDISVLHGRTLVAPVEFGKCLRAIKENAFIRSPYPVIVTLEDHLTPELQHKAAKEMMDILGNRLYFPTSDEVKHYPSPTELKGKILISTKPPKEDIDAAIGTSSTSMEHTKRKMKDRQKRARKPTLRNDNSSSDEEEDIEDDNELDEEGADEANRTPERNDKGHASPDYKNLIAIHGGKEKGKFLKIEENVKRVSVSEPRLTKIAASNPASIIEFTRDNFLRIYPKGMRINSSNYNPMKAWSHGAQMVAINMQGHGKHLWVTQGFFRANGGCGYVKKPDYLLYGNVEGLPDALKWKNTMLDVKKFLKVKVYMGYGWKEQLGKNKFDKFSPPDFYTRVGIAGIKADSTMKKTRVLNDKWEPIWDEEFQFAIRAPELAVLRIEVHEADHAAPDTFAGQICLPVDELKEGFRVVTLCDKKGNAWKLVKLLLRINIHSSKSYRADNNPILLAAPACSFPGQAFLLRHYSGARRKCSRKQRRSELGLLRLS